MKVLIRSAKERRGGTRGYAEAMLIEYNKRLRTQLPWDWLYKSKAALLQSKEELNRKSADSKDEGEQEEETSHVESVSSC